MCVCTCLCIIVKPASIVCRCPLTCVVQYSHCRITVNWLNYPSICLTFHYQLKPHEHELSVWGRERERKRERERERERVCICVCVHLLISAGDISMCLTTCLKKLWNSFSAYTPAHEDHQQTYISCTNSRCFCYSTITAGSKCWSCNGYFGRQQDSWWQHQRPRHHFTKWVNSVYIKLYWLYMNVYT